MGAVNTTYTFTATDTITSTKMNNIIDQTTFTNDAVFDTTLAVASGKLKVNTQGITSNELAANAVKTIAIEDGAVTQEKTSNFLVPTGAVMPFAMDSAPTGWLVANGVEYLKTAYPALFTAIGATYNPAGYANSATMFCVPDLQGYFIRGFGTAAGSGAFGEQQSDAFASHTHTAIQTIDSNGSFDSGSSRPRYGGSGSTGSAGGATETRPKNIAMLYCIKI